MLQSKLTQMATLKATMSDLFSVPSDDAKRQLKNTIHTIYDSLCKNDLTEGHTFLVGNQFTVADAYLYIALRWEEFHGVKAAAFPALSAFFDRVAVLDAVKAAHAIFDRVLEDNPEHIAETEVQRQQIMAEMQRVQRL